jgi:hypothetical protein
MVLQIHKSGLTVTPINISSEPDPWLGRGEASRHGLLQMRMVVGSREGGVPGWGHHVQLHLQFHCLWTMESGNQGPTSQRPVTHTGNC